MQSRQSAQTQIIVIAATSILAVSAGARPLSAQETTKPAVTDNKSDAPSATASADATITRPLKIDRFTTQDLDQDFGTLPGNNLTALPRGKQVLDGVEFLIGSRFIQLAGKRAPDFPEIAADISVGGRVQKLHFLHAAGWGYSHVKDGATVGEYVVHHGSGETTRVPLVYGEHLRDWWALDRGLPTSHATLAWTGENEAAKNWRTGATTIRLYHMTWQNPRPDDTVESIDFVSANETPCAPFALAISAERFPRTESAAIRRLKEVGAQLEYENERLISISMAGQGPNAVEPRNTDAVAAIAATVGPVSRIYADHGVFTDAGIESLTKVPGLRWLSLNNSNVTDEAMTFIGRAKTLERLQLANSKITDAGLRRIVELEQLKVLDLSGTQVTDEGLEPIARFQKIERVDLRNTPVSAEAKESFAARYPRGVIRY